MTSHLPGRAVLRKGGGSRGSCSTLRASPIVNATPNEADEPAFAGLRIGAGGRAERAIVSISLLQPHPFTAQLQCRRKRCHAITYIDTSKTDQAFDRICKKYMLHRPNLPQKWPVKSHLRRKRCCAIPYIENRPGF